MTTDELKLDITIDENNLIAGAIDVVKHIRPTWIKDRLKYKIFTDGITNKLIGIYEPDYYDEMVLVRIYGNKTDLLINRVDETRNIRILNKAGYTHALYATFNNGLAYEFLPGEILTIKSVREPNIYSLIAKRMAQMHKLILNDYPDIDREPMIWKKTEQFMNLMPKYFNDPHKQSRFETMIKPYEILKKEYNILKNNLIVLNSPIVYSHNDLLLANVLYDEVQNTVTFIDFEYTAFNYQAFDIANHFAEFAGVDNIDYSLYPEETLQRSWLRIYLQSYNGTSNVSEDDVTKIYQQIQQFVLLAHFFWGCWALIQYEYSTIDFDFLQFAATRFDEFFKHKNNLNSQETKIPNNITSNNIIKN